MTQSVKHSQPAKPRRWRRGAALAAVSVAAMCLPAMLHGRQQPAKSPDAAGALAARDLHQGLLIAADPVLTSDRSQQIFGKKHPYGVGILALDVYLRNDTDGPMQVNLDTFELKVAAPGQSRQRIEPLTAEDAAFQIVLPDGPNPKQRRGPLPGMGKTSGKSKDVAKMEESLRGQMLPGDMIGPHSTVHGFVFFDVDRHFEWVRNATLVVPDVRVVASGEKLFFFEVDLAPAVR
ncbi:MAG TPA: hypothetical protein VKG84_03980 [Candidatus Acidoferrales bacterium]|nr:hypothetical protein [Candidatus Acidoferrales bacterium]